MQLTSTLALTGWLLLPVVTSRAQRGRTGGSTDGLYVNCPYPTAEYVGLVSDKEVAVCCPGGWVLQPQPDSNNQLTCWTAWKAGAGTNKQSAVNQVQVADLHRACKFGAKVWEEHPRACLTPQI